MRYLVVLIMYIFVNFAMIGNLGAQITILNQGTDNPTLLYKGKPMFKFGPLPETAIFSVKWGTPGFPHIEWLNWMEQNKLGYGRVYPESGVAIGGPTDTEVQLDDKNRLFPFKVAYWKEGKPVFDITEFNPLYWDNFSRVIAECASRGIILQMQLYQRVYFSERGSWHGNYYHPENNINKFSFPERNGGYGLLSAMTHDPVWRKLHTNWVHQILAGIGNSGNVIIDLMNEGTFEDAGLTREWVEHTLDEIEIWGNQNGITILTGFDYDHLLKKRDPNLEWVLAHPRMDVIISEGSEGHVVPELVAGIRRSQERNLAIEFRDTYRKPVISANSPSYTITQDLWKLHLYQWYSLMVKMQGVGLYAKEFPLDFDDPAIKEYAMNSRILSDFFNRINDYAKLELASGIIAKAPGKYRMALASENELVIYLHSGVESEKIKRSRTLIKDFYMPGVENVSINIISPSSGESLIIKGRIRKNILMFKLPDFENDIAIHIIAIR